MKKTMPLCLTWISLFCWVLAGCSTDKDTLLPHGEQNMLDIWNGAGTQGEIIASLFTGLALLFSVVNRRLLGVEPIDDDAGGCVTVA